ncbi:HNH endonuclease [Pseudomonas aeruginosa]|uniref:HNH endonuclease n=1 Tax=Pseudomonas aeruginosa TaxID=287 RepID=UPI001EED452E|nr:HNH endonuclease [Pseudomonas aeruginosa]MCG7015168.1 HNH endonuclease [Pseudomonas aeruginosa]MCG7027848.1 HNH endonuclease [Pseudomonas aeruginosa]MCG7057075.1 HNH endonuclease [Pseudomonas aeruginosa]MCG7062900.1 HNH endonuclease [Pseudomonas aeruginosa]HDP4830715.1 HNH endonuclease [Pseudomonas aeruginosa]
MPTCRICQHTFKSLKFQTEHIDICTRCVNTLNESPEPAKSAEARFAEKLARGMLRNFERNLRSKEEWKRRKAEQTLANLDAAVAARLHDWITKLLADPRNSTRDFKIMRAHRRGLLRTEGLSDYADRNWKDVAQRIRRRDGLKCMVCGATSTTLDVHHIIYLSHHGTNQQSNLITLCRKCHEAEHDRIFDWPESQDPESASPIQPLHSGQTALFEPSQTARTSKPSPETSNHATLVQTEQISGVDQGSAQGNAAAGNGDRQPLDAGLAKDRQGAAGNEPVSGRSDGAGSSGTERVQQSGQQAPGAARDSRPVRTEQRPSDSVADPATAEASSKLRFDGGHAIEGFCVGGRPVPAPVSIPAQAPRCQGHEQQRNESAAANTQAVSWKQEQVATARNRRTPNWGVMIGGVIFWSAVVLLVINLLHR